jgi:hypothetical protein
MALFDNTDERTSALIVVAGIAAHALIQKPTVAFTDGGVVDSIIRASFQFAEKFLAEVERRAK